LEKDRLCAVARRIVHDASRAEDVIHDAFAQRFMPDLNECAWDHIICDYRAGTRCGEPLAAASALSVCKSFSNAALPARASHAAGERKVVAHASARSVLNLSAGSQPAAWTRRERWLLPRMA
jgi:hypothetical protein